jgi:hypothetical protein
VDVSPEGNRRRGDFVREALQTRQSITHSHGCRQA